MLKQYPMLRYVLQKAFWYLLTFVVAVAINFTLPRMGENNPVDIIMGKAAQGLSPEQAKLKKETLLKWSNARRLTNRAIRYSKRSRFSTRRASP